jgi:hypothetical protein
VAVDCVAAVAGQLFLSRVHFRLYVNDGEVDAMATSFKTTLCAKRSKKIAISRKGARGGCLERLEN